MSKPRLLDLFCGAGGAAKGYQRAGFYVVGVDINPQPNYCGDEFLQEDALLFMEEEFGLRPYYFDAIHASPPCPRYSTIGKQAQQTGRAIEAHHPDLVAPVRDLLEQTGLPYVIENVVGAPLHAPALLCGSMFGLDFRRHRLFETNFPLLVPACQHGAWKNSYTQARYHGGKRLTVGRTIGIYGGGQGMGPGEGELWRKAMGIDWMTRREMAQAIPPAYTELIGHQLLAHIAHTQCAPHAVGEEQ